jgi:hypothetical protein
MTRVVQASYETAGGASRGRDPCGHPDACLHGDQRSADDVFGRAAPSLLHLVAQAVPTATLFPCIDRLAPGWTYGGSEVRSGFVHFWLDSDRVGTDAVDVTMAATCDVTGDTVKRVRTSDARLLLYHEPDAEHPTHHVRHYIAAGACTTVPLLVRRRRQNSSRPKGSSATSCVPTT